MSDSSAVVEEPKKGSCLLKGLLVVLILLLLGVLLGGALWWWQNRPIDPVVLSAEEKQVLEQKVEAVRQVAPLEPAEPGYQRGKKEIILTERELNGLLNERTSLGTKVKFELATDAVHARVEMDLDPDLPGVGGKRLKARARFLVTEDDTGAHFVIDDVTVWGVSLPNDWLAGLKGRDLIAEIFGCAEGGLPGVQSLKVSPGRVAIRLKE